MTVGVAPVAIQRLPSSPAAMTVEFVLAGSGTSVMSGGGAAAGIVTFSSAGRPMVTQSNLSRPAAMAALPSVSRHSAQDIRQRIHIETAGWRSPEETFPRLPTLQEAVWQERRLRLTYRRADDSAVERIVDPLGLVAKGSTWYLVAAVEGDPRTYRVSRIQDAALLDEPAAPLPDGFDLAAHWECSAVEFKSQIPKYATTVRVDPALLGHITGTARFATVAREYPPDADGWVRLDMLFDGGEHNAREFALSFDARVEVLSPPELRESVLRAAERIVALYSEKAGVAG